MEKIGMEIKDLRILDLSGGTGMLGIALASAGAFVTVSETGKEQLELLQKNIDRNENILCEGRNIRVRSFAWGEDVSVFNSDSAPTLMEDYDLICCSDLLYPATKFGLTTELLSSFKSICTQSKQNASIFFCYENRSCSGTESVFKDEIKKWFDCEQIAGDDLASCVADVTTKAKPAAASFLAAIRARTKRELDFSILKLQLKR
eukprot:TRINITY_DN12642_c0_g1_i1.p1 TRINITY_DN12642_c0_g1~~TRINITY_DN12642_c0_g1_i1.p1  ORF type:complete len:224 (-),score=35.75 TRINITY_DN12642_c0_g1_i1:63-674(-)